MKFDRPLVVNSHEEQGKYLRETGNGPTADDEEALLREEFGEPDASGVYGAVEQHGEGVER